MSSATGQREHIFLSYRRDDARGASGRLYDWLRIAFGRERVFRDVASIGLGKFSDKINRALARSKICVAVIGPRWANVDNLPRLHQAEDWVRHELATALASEEMILAPTLVEGADIPPTDGLPEALRSLFDWNAHRVTEDGWEDDTRRLIAEIAKATDLPVGPDLDTLLRDVGSARQRVAELEETRQLQADLIAAQRRTLDELTSKLAEASASDRPGLAAAFDALAKGDSLAAEDAFEREYEAQNRVAESAQQTAAEAARNVANLAASHDVLKAVQFYRKALAIEPEHAETLRLLGHSLVSRGDLPAAKQAFCDSLRIAQAQHDEWGEMAAQGGIGEVLFKLGAGAGALAAYRKALAIAETLAACDPANTQWQRDLSVSHIKIGDVLVAQGDGAGALAAYRKALAIRETLAARDPANTEWQRDLSVSHDRIGDVLVAQGDGAGALAAYRKALAIRETLAARDPANTQWQVDVAVSCAKLGTHAVLPHISRTLRYADRPRALRGRLRLRRRSWPDRRGRQVAVKA